jgi:hypothetical protein
MKHLLDVCLGALAVFSSLYSVLWQGTPATTRAASRRYSRLPIQCHQDFRAVNPQTIFAINMLPRLWRPYRPLSFRARFPSPLGWAEE